MNHSTIDKTIVRTCQMAHVLRSVIETASPHYLVKWITEMDTIQYRMWSCGMATSRSSFATKSGSSETEAQFWNPIPNKIINNSKLESPLTSQAKNRTAFSERCMVTIPYLITNTNSAFMQSYVKCHFCQCYSPFSRHIKIICNFSIPMKNSCTFCAPCVCTKSRPQFFVRFWWIFWSCVGSCELKR